MVRPQKDYTELDTWAKDLEKEKNKTKRKRSKKQKLKKIFRKNLRAGSEST